MHTYAYGSDVTINYNSDYSGNCIITNKSTNESVEIPCQAITSFVSKRVKDEMVSLIENMSDAEDSDVVVMRNCYNYRFVTCPMCKSDLRVKRNSLKYEYKFGEETAPIDCPCCKNTFSVTRRNTIGY